VYAGSFIVLALASIAYFEVYHMNYNFILWHKVVNNKTCFLCSWTMHISKGHSWRMQHYLVILLINSVLPTSSYFNLFNLLQTILTKNSNHFQLQPISINLYQSLLKIIPTLLHFKQFQPTSTHFNQLLSFNTKKYQLLSPSPTFTNFNLLSWFTKSYLPTKRICPKKEEAECFVNIYAWLLM